MKYNKAIYLLIIPIIFLSIGFCLTTFKMFQFRDRLHEFIDNDRWEMKLYNNQIYDNNTIVFFGDSQIDLWLMAPSFGSLPIMNRGISGDWALKAVGRFQEDVLSINPKSLVILIGTNDLGNGQSKDSIINNIDNMLNRAAIQDIRIILCSLLPVSGMHISNHPLKDILEINNNLKLLAQKYNADYVDYFSKLSNSKGLFLPELTSDGLHPNRLGYIKMSHIILPYLIKNYDLTKK